MKVVIVGGVAGGASAAARIRRLDEKAQITVFERSGYVSYANCGLPYYIGGAITDESELTLKTPQSFQQRFRIDIHVKHEVTAIHPEEKRITVRNLNTGEAFDQAYDKLLLAPGAKPIQPRVTGGDLPELFTLRTVEDTLRIRRFVERQKPRSAVLIGGGFISIELAENLRELGLHVTIVELQNQLLAPLDAEMASFVQAKLRREGVRLLLGAAATGFAREGEGIRVSLGEGQAVDVDMVVLAIGVAPDSALAKEAGLTLGARGSIAVNDRMQTSNPDIYAVGDAVEVRNSVTGQKTLIALAGPANKQGRIAADNICGGNSVYRGAQGSSVIKVFNMTVAATGVNERAAKSAGIACDKLYLSPMSHASYYPGGQTMTMKLVYELATYRLLGAQIVGYDGVDKRIDVLATAIHAGLCGTELAELDLAYAPPYSSAKDPVNMAGYIFDNIADGKLRQFHWDELESLPKDGSVTLLDTRTAKEYEGGHAEGFINLPVDELRGRMSEIAKDKPVYVMCQSGLRSYLACRMLSLNGYECYNFSGGYRLYASVRQERLAAEKSLPCGLENA